LGTALFSKQAAPYLYISIWQGAKALNYVPLDNLFIRDDRLAKGFAYSSLSGTMPGAAITFFSKDAPAALG
jgi:hypothetical protein